MFLIAEKQRKFNQGVGYVYQSLCLSMLPVTALSYLVSKLIPGQLNDQRGVIINAVFFGGWLLTALFFWWKKNNYFTNKYTLLIAGIFGVCIPVANRTVSGSHYQLSIIDVLWMALAVTALGIVYRMRRQPLV